MQRVAPPSAARVALQESGSAPASCRRLRVRGPAPRGHVGRGPGEADAGSGNACPPSGAGRDGAGRRGGCGAAQQAYADGAARWWLLETRRPPAGRPRTGSVVPAVVRRLAGACRPSTPLGTEALTPGGTDAQPVAWDRFPRPSAPPPPPRPRAAGWKLGAPLCLG